MDPNEIIALFKEKWVGTAEELSVAIDYYANHYGEDAIEAEDA